MESLPATTHHPSSGTLLKSKCSELPKCILCPLSIFVKILPPKIPSSPGWASRFSRFSHVEGSFLDAHSALERGPSSLPYTATLCDCLPPSPGPSGS